MARRKNIWTGWRATFAEVPDVLLTLRQDYKGKRTQIEITEDLCGGWFITCWELPKEN